MPGHERGKSADLRLMLRAEVESSKWGSGTVQEFAEAVLLIWVLVVILKRSCRRGRFGLQLSLATSPIFMRAVTTVCRTRLGRYCLISTGACHEDRVANVATYLRKILFTVLFQALSKVALLEFSGAKTAWSSLTVHYDYTSLQLAKWGKLRG
jgi:hypothetical protein